MRIAIILLTSLVTVIVMGFDLIYALEDLRAGVLHHAMQWLTYALLLFYCVGHTFLGHGGDSN